MNVASPLDSPGGHGAPGRWITARSVLLGTLAVVLVCSLAPYNDFVVANTFLIGSFVPVVLVLWFFVLIVLVNGPLHRWAPRWALGSGELAVVMAMMLVACSIPGQGLMRALLPTLVVPFHFGGLDERFWRAFVALDLPEWLFPVQSITEGRRDPVVLDFYGRLDQGQAMPWQAWILPLAGWGVFVFAMFGAMIMLALLLRRQWAVNERLPFPIVQLQVALIEPPRPGRLLNDLLGSRSFWVGLSGVVVLQSLVALHQYFPRYVPEVPLSFDLSGVFAEEPWVYLSPRIKSSTIFFTFIGIAYFIQSRVAFSIWGIFIIVQLISVQQRMMHHEMPRAAWLDQNLGASVVFVAGLLWIGRRHWAMVLRQAVRGRSPEDPEDDYLSSRVALAGLITAVLVMLGWLLVVGVQIWMAIGIVLMLLLVHLVIARVVAETGMPFGRAYGSVSQIYTNLPPEWVSGRDVFFGGVFTINGSFTTRESLLPFALHGFQTYEATSPQQPQRRWLLGLIAWALVLGFIVSAASSLACYYTYATPLTDRIQDPLNPHLLTELPRPELVEPLNRHADGRYSPKAYSPWAHMAIGGGVTALLHVAALRWAGWPFMPVGYLLSASWYTSMVWFSIMLGWLCKVLIVKYGGAILYQQARPFFVGIIFGEAIVAGLWLMINLMLALAGYDYQPVNLLPP